MKIYLSGPIVGKLFSEAATWREEVSNLLSTKGFTVFNPLRGTTENQASPNGGVINPHPLLYPPGMSDKAFVQRDKLDVLACDIVLANFMDATKVSIGSLYELAWAEDHNKVVVVAMNKEDKLYNHPFIRETCIVFNTLEDSVDYILSCGI